jgi:hypothetical protein
MPRRKILPQRVETNTPRRAQARPCTRQCAHGTNPGTPRAPAPSLPRITSTLILCASRLTTSPCIAWTWPLARGNAAGDDHDDDRPPRTCALPSNSPSFPTLIFTAITRVRFARTPTTVRAHHLPLRRPGTATTTTTLVERHGHLQQL